MNTLIHSFYRDVTCAAAAAVITLTLSAAFVQSTSVAPGTHAPMPRMLALQTHHAWFGQPQPAVLVD
jgi:hypothetical protein